MGRSATPGASMRGSTVGKWKDCIVVLMDLMGVKRRALEGDSSGSALMRSFHDLVRQEMAGGLDALDRAYVWNDSVLLLAYVDGRSEAYKKAIRAADCLKRKVDSTAPSYAIALKGRAFPTADIDDTRVTVIKASSYAMANCFAVESEAKSKKLRKAWYIDVRIARNVPEALASEWIMVPLLPTGKRRRVYVHGGYLWAS